MIEFLLLINIFFYACCVCFLNLSILFLADTIPIGFVYTMIWVNALICLVCAYMATHGERGALGFFISLQTIGKLHFQPQVSTTFTWYPNLYFNFGISVVQLHICTLSVLIGDYDKKLKYSAIIFLDLRFILKGKSREDCSSRGRYVRVSL